MIRVDGRGRGLIVNVDDFGLTTGINRGVIEAHRDGIVTSASLMVNTAATEDAVREARRHPGLSLGIHVNFTNEGEHVVELDDVAACAHELECQLELFLSLVGRPPTHVDSHHHVHRRPRLNSMFAAAARRFGVPLRDDGSVAYFGSFYAAWDGESHPEQVTVASLADMLAGLDADVTELSTHVGHVDPSLDSEYAEERELELATIVDPRVGAIVDELGFELLGYGELEEWRAS